MAKITIDDKEYEVDDKQNLLQECLSKSLDLPYFCWHPSMGSVGSCRQCAVIEYADENDERGRMVMSCMTAPRDGARYSIKNAAKFRANAIESIMISHPHDCPVCEEGGECHLQDMTVMSGHNYRRYDGKKVTHTNQYLGPFIGHEMNRCITCYRCVRYYKDYAGGTDFGPQASHHHTYFGRFQEGPLESEFSGNLVEVCPTGVFTDKVFSKHYSRKWDLQTAPSICTGCSVGCNTAPGERYGTLRRVSNRFNDQVNGYFLCDRGRFGSGYVNSEYRISECMTRVSKNDDPLVANPQNSIDQLKTIANGAVGIGSPRASLESNMALQNLVGEANFYAGLNAIELENLHLVLDVYRNTPASIPSISDIEQADAILILGEDITNTAARAALGVRQAVKNKRLSMAAELNFPLWHDAAIRQLGMDKLSPLHILNGAATRLDDVAETVTTGDSQQLARLGFAIAHALNADAPAVEGLSEEELGIVATISEDLKNASKPLIISGTGCMSGQIIQAAANIASSLDIEKDSMLALFPAETNSLGLAMLTGPEQHLENAFNSGIVNAIVLENDLYRREATQVVDDWIASLDQLAVLDSLQNRTGEQANLVLPSASYAESSGTYVNYETRAQHFYTVFLPEQAIRPAHEWLQTELSLSELTQACAAALENGDKLEKLSPGKGFNFAGLKAARQQARYSGRTAMNANINVHEPRQSADKNGAMVFSMEGIPPAKDATIIASTWSPGWNSNQSVFKFQEEAGGALRQASAGEILIQATGESKQFYTPETNSGVDAYSIIPLYQLFGSEELSAMTDEIRERSSSAFIALNPDDASSLLLETGDSALLNKQFHAPVIIRSSIKQGTIGIAVGLEGLNIHDLDKTVSVSKAENQDSSSQWQPVNLLMADKVTSNGGEHV